MLAAASVLPMLKSAKMVWMFMVFIDTNIE